MPVYPCARCGSPVDPTTDIQCMKCSDRNPYECSRCNKRMSSDSIFQLERLRTKRPLLCNGCGESGEVVKCGICKLSLVRSTGKQLSSEPGARVYHIPCFEKQLKTVAWIKRLIPMVAILGLLVGVLLGQNKWGGGVPAQIAGALVTAAVFGAATYGLAQWQTPK